MIFPKLYQPKAVYSTIQSRQLILYQSTNRCHMSSSGILHGTCFVVLPFHSVYTTLSVARRQWLGVASIQPRCANVRPSVSHITAGLAQLLQQCFTSCSRKHTPIISRHCDTVADSDDWCIALPRRPSSIQRRLLLRGG